MNTEIPTHLVPRICSCLAHSVPLLPLAQKLVSVTSPSLKPSVLICPTTNYGWDSSVSHPPKEAFLVPYKSVNGNRSERRQCHVRPHTRLLTLEEIYFSPDIVYSSPCYHLCITNFPRILGITESKSNSLILGKPTSSQIENAPLYKVLPPCHE